MRKLKSKREGGLGAYVYFRHDGRTWRAITCRCARCSCTICDLIAEVRGATQLLTVRVGSFAAASARGLAQAHESLILLVCLHRATVRVWL